MNYKAIYDRLMERARNRTLSGYSESHHVVPRCMGGGDERENLVRLRPEEHLVAHELLVFIYPTHSKLIYSLLAMTMNIGGRLNNKMFGWMRRRVAKEISKAKTGVARPREMMEKIWRLNVGRKAPLEEIQRMKAAMTGRTLSAAHRENLSAAWQSRTNKTPMAGKTHSPETKEKMRLAALARKHTAQTIEKLTQFAAKQTPEQRSARAHKAWETKRAKLQAGLSETLNGKRRG